MHTKDMVKHHYDSNITSMKREYPIFVLDLVYGWPIDPRNEYTMKDFSLSKLNGTLQNSTEELDPEYSELNSLNETDIGTKLWWAYISAIVGICVLSTSLQLVKRSANNNVTKVVFFQGCGVLIYTLAGKYNT